MVTSSDSSGPAANPTRDEAEFGAARAEVARLKAEQEPAEPADRTGWWRPVVAGVLVIIAAVLAPLSVLSTWANGQINDTDRYIETVGPLANDPDVQDAIAARVEQVIFSYLDIDAATEALVARHQRAGTPCAGRSHAPGGCRAARVRHRELRLRTDPRVRAIRRLRGRVGAGEPGGALPAGGGSHWQR